MRVYDLFITHDFPTPVPPPGGGGGKLPYINVGDGRRKMF